MALKLRDKLIVMLEQRGTAESAFNAVDGKIDRVATTVVFSSANRILVGKWLKKKGNLH